MSGGSEFQVDFFARALFFRGWDTRAILRQLLHTQDVFRQRKICSTSRINAFGGFLISLVHLARTTSIYSASNVLPKESRRGQNGEGCTTKNSIQSLMGVEWGRKYWNARTVNTKWLGRKHAIASIEQTGCLMRIFIKIDMIILYLFCF